MDGENYVLTMGYDPLWLLKCLQTRLSDKEGLFRKLIIVPSRLMKDRISSMLSQQDKIMTGVKILQLPMAIDYLMRLMLFEDERPHTFPAASLLALHLEHLITREENNQQLQPLWQYLSDDNPSKTKAKIQELSRYLSHDFINYGVYGGKALKTWLETDHWQTALWHLLFSVWDYPYKIFQQNYKPSIQDLEIEIHMIGFNFIPHIYEEFLGKLSSSFRLYEYYFNPCAHFWGDICSEKERFSLHRKHKRRDVKAENIIELDTYLISRNTLLANFGKQTQRRFNQLLDKNCVLIEEQVEEEHVAKSLLEAVQQNIRFGKEETSSWVIDDSLQFHRAPSKKREIEVLLVNLMKLAKEQELLPSDILVLAPSMEDYFPFVTQVFDDKQPFSIQIYDLAVLSQGIFLQGFWELISLKDKKWDQADIFRLLTLKPFRDKRGWSSEQVRQLKAWAEAASIMWGFDRSHREELIGKQETCHTSEIGTWSYGLKKLLLGLSVSAQDTKWSEEYNEFYPLEVVDMVHSELLGDFVSLMQELYEDMQYYSRVELCITDWIGYFHTLAKKYFLLDEQDSEAKQAWGFFEEQLKTLSQLAGKVEDSLYSFSSMHHFFQEVFSKCGAMFSTANKEALCFASIKPQQIYPAKVICLLGMEEGIYPRSAQTSSLRAISDKDLDPRPTLVEEDRQSLLDVLLHAETSVIISYCSVNSKDSERNSPSFLIEELLQTLRNNYGVTGEVWSTHKHLSFHHEEITSSKRYFSLRDYRLANSLYGMEKKKKFFIPEFYTSFQLSSEESHASVISLKDLKTFSRNPLQHYFNHALGLYFKKENRDEELSAREFVFPSLEKMRFKLSCLDREFEDRYAPLQILGKVPTGIFGEITKDELEQERAELLDHLLKLGIDPHQMITLELDVGCDQPFQQKERHWILPALKLDLSSGKPVQIEGAIDLVSQRGLCTYNKEGIQDYVKIWPVYLVFLELVDHYFPNKIGKEILFLKDAKIKKCPENNPKECLNRYLEYYFSAQQTPSPFLPMWAEAFLSNSKDKLEKVIHQSFMSGNGIQRKFMDEYQKWAFDHLHPFSAEILHNRWHQPLSIAFGQMMKWDIQGADHA